MTITAGLVKELRERTGAGMMECKKALVETSGDIDKAIEIMRKSGAAKADKKASRTAAEGLIAIKLDDSGKIACMVEVNSETDFVARDDNFVEFANLVVDTALSNDISDVAQLLETEVNGKTVEATRKALIAKIGENINVRRVEMIHAETGTLGHYIHGNRIGVVVNLSTENADLAKDIAMHVAASNPQVILPEDFPEAELAKEKEIFLAKSKDSGKPEAIVEKIVAGQINKFLNQVSLVGQPFVKDPDVTVGNLLKNEKAEAKRFVRFEVGEGIEKEEVDFRKEVMEQARGN